MLRFRIKTLLVAAMAAGVLLVGSMSTARSAGTNLPIDVALQSQGCFVGRVTKTDGHPEAHAAFAIYNDQGLVVRGFADQQGLVTVDGLQGGVYQLVVGMESHLLRLWADRTAPPSAIREVLLVQDPGVVRAQWAAPRPLNNLARRVKFGARNPLVFGAVLTAAVGVPVIVHNLNQDDNS
jgi:hypothetical protein